MKCKECPYIIERLKQQEETIAQLVDIIGSTNRRLMELDQRQPGVEHQVIRERSSLFIPSK
ncbi:hypothetical protein SAMN05192559_101128 [Halobacillus karajensis]|uniref:hypothetical protein n=1 Tax=Halobacillus karajensis TaxID=195088 RepID=UPI0008A7D20A|nr:hypothetical protein [Halobacillus karajensis]SEH39873.1 hypothetical protein SAMN05192559_101128 [Halobacillus karajensis]